MAAEETTSKGKRKPDAERPSAGRGDAAPQGPDRVEVTLEHSRWRHLGWALFGATLGSVLSFKLGTVGKLIGLAIMAGAVWHVFGFARTMIYPAGTFVVAGGELVLPLGL